MFRPQQTVVPLLEIHDAAGAAYFLEGSQCEHLACHFVGCNLTMDLVDFLLELFQPTDTPITLGITFRDLHGWLNDPSTAPPARLDDLRLWDAYLDLANGPDMTNPWRRVHTWLLLEVVLRPVLRQRPSPATRWGRLTFEEPLTEVGLASMPVVCEHRAAVILRAFDNWWTSTADALANCLHQHLWPLPARTQWTPRSLCAQLAQGQLPREPLIKLVEMKNDQLMHCVSQLNRGVHYPGRTGLVSRLLYARQARHSAGWARQQATELRHILEWVANEGLAGRFGGIQGLLGSRLWTLAHSEDTRLPVTELDRIAGQLTILDQLARTRGLTPNWRAGRHLQDLFSYPLDAGFRFEDWLAGTANYW